MSGRLADERARDRALRAARRPRRRGRPCSSRSVAQPAPDLVADAIVLARRAPRQPSRIAALHVDPHARRPVKMRLRPRVAARAIDQDEVGRVVAGAPWLREELAGRPAGAWSRSGRRRRWPVVGEPAVDADRALRLRPKPWSDSTIDRRVRPDRVEHAGRPRDRARRRRASTASRTAGSSGRRARALGIDVLPEVVLHAIGRVEDDAQRVDRPRRHHARPIASAREPRLARHALQVRERALTIVAHPERRRFFGGGRSISYSPSSPATSGGSRERAAPAASACSRRRSPPAIGRIGYDGGTLMTPTRASRRGRHVPDRRRAEIARVREAGPLVAVPRQASKAVHAVPAGILAGHERSDQAGSVSAGTVDAQTSPRPASHERRERRAALPDSAHGAKDSRSRRRARR